MIGLVMAVCGGRYSLADESPAESSKLEDKFIVRTEIFVKAERGSLEKDKLVCRNETYFLNERIIDLGLSRNGTPESATILELNSGNITLCDLSSKSKCTLSYDDLLEAVAAVTSRLEDKPAIVKFAAEPEFDVEWDSDSSQLNMTAAPMSYRLFTSSKRGNAVALLYRRFADMSARLNVTRPGGLPPKARLEINRELQTRNLIPLRVELTRGDRPFLVYSTHEFDPKLTAEDEQSIAAVGSWQEQFEPTDLVSFRLGKNARLSQK